jgi:RNA-directed DNA polymerase
LLRSAHGWLRKEAAAGGDGVTWEEYGQGLEHKLADLHSRIHQGAYRAQPSRRVYIPKLDGRYRPLCIAALSEDKIVQRELVEVLDAICEEDFPNCILRKNERISNLIVSVYEVLYH